MEVVTGEILAGDEEECSPAPLQARAAPAGAKFAAAAARGRAASCVQQQALHPWYHNPYAAATIAAMPQSFATDLLLLNARSTHLIDVIRHAKGCPHDVLDLLVVVL